MRSVLCPKCKRDVEIPEKIDGSGVFPFCSPRCRDADFTGWATDAYTISRPLTPEEMDALFGTE